MGGDQGPGKARRSAEGRIVVTFDLDFGEIAGLAATGEALAEGAVVLVEDTRIRVRRMRAKERAHDLAAGTRRVARAGAAGAVAGRARQDRAPAQGRAADRARADRRAGRCRELSRGRSDRRAGRI